MTEMDDVNERHGGVGHAGDEVSERVGAVPGESGAGSADASTADSATLSAAEDWHRLLDEQRDKYLRLAAEFDNYRKRTTRERQEAGWRAQGDLVQGLTETLDDIMRFAHVDPATTDAATVVQGVVMVEKKLLKSLAGHGLEVVEPTGQPFDPNLHEALRTEQAATPEEDHLVARVYQVGYVFRGQLLRPARVVVWQWNG
ncbi:MAG: Protein GrpE [Gemmatimonadaceae bacterium]|nr:Protein GrpE [Gemmatimonadaceae bacterium]